MVPFFIVWVKTIPIGDDEFAVEFPNIKTIIFWSSCLCVVITEADIDLDDLLYDLVKFNPERAVMESALQDTREEVQEEQSQAHVGDIASPSFPLPPPTTSLPVASPPLSPTSPEASGRVVAAVAGQSVQLGVGVNVNGEDKKFADDEHMISEKRRQLVIVFVRFFCFSRSSVYFTHIPCCCLLFLFFSVLSLSSSYYILTCNLHSSTVSKARMACPCDTDISACRL